MKRNRILTDTVIGITFGFLFPIVASLLTVYTKSGFIDLKTILAAQTGDPLLWIIDSAPLFLGLFAYMVGVRADRIERMNARLEQEFQQRGEMVAQLETLRANLEKKVVRQVTELKASAQVGRAAASIHEPGQLLAEVSELISTQFGFYHTGIFLIDEAREYAILQAANSVGGQRMLSHGHKLPVGKVGIVGFVAEKGEPRIALDVGQDAVFFNNPDLPYTRSEMALPLKASGEIIGVLDVQSTEPSAFGDEDVEVLQLLADQVALAIQNARLIQESRRAVQELENLYKEQVRRDWNKKLRRQTMAYRYNRLGVEPASNSQLQPAPDQAGSNELQVPLMLRGELLGAIVLRRDPNQPAWTADELSLAKEAAGQVTAALENARLFEEVQARAAREQALSQLTAGFTRTASLETLLKRTAQELGRLPDVAEVSIQVGVNQNGG